jgi:hypothetical protein
VRGRGIMGYVILVCLDDFGLCFFVLMTSVLVWVYLCLCSVIVNCNV